MNEIIPGLWLGSRPTESQILHLREVSLCAILTIDTKPLRANRFKLFRKLFKYANDKLGYGLFESFKEAFKFIEKNLESGVSVYW